MIVLRISLLFLSIAGVNNNSAEDNSAENNGAENNNAKNIFIICKYNWY